MDVQVAAKRFGMSVKLNDDEREEIDNKSFINADNKKSKSKGR